MSSLCLLAWAPQSECDIVRLLTGVAADSDPEGQQVNCRYISRQRGAQTHVGEKPNGGRPHLLLAKKSAASAVKHV